MLERINRTYLFSLFIIEVEAEATEIIPAMTDTVKFLDKGIMIRMEEAMCVLDPHPDEIIHQEDHIQGGTIKEVTADSPDLEAHPDSLLGGLELV